MMLILSLPAQAKQIKVAIVDTGINIQDVSNLKLCKNGLIDLTGTNISDTLHHGSNIAGIIANRLEKIDYCAYVIKVYGGKLAEYEFLFRVPLYHLIAFMLTYDLDVDVINYSSGGVYSETEEVLIKGLLNKGVIIDVAAGNRSQDLDLFCNYWPACIKGITTVGDLNKDHTPNVYSNYGRNTVKVWEIGEDVCAGGLCLSGTSMATAVHTAKVIKQLYYKSLKEIK